MRTRALAAFLALSAVVLAACGSDSKSSETKTADTKGASTKGTEHVALRLGYFPNITHAPALVGVQEGIFAKDLGPNVTLKTATFNAGPAAVEAIFSGALDASFVGPNPSINAFVKSKGEAVRVISGSTSGGAFLVVKPEINDAAELKGKKVASPQLGGTQDVSLRNWLGSQGLKTDPQGGGDVSIVPQENPQTLDTFRSGQIAGAWVPEPWATRLVQEGGGKVLVDEAKDVWPDQRFVTTNLLVTTKFLDAHPDVVKNLLNGLVDSLDAMKKDPAAAQKAANAAIAAVTGKPLPDKVISASWQNLTFTADPIPASLKKMAADAVKLGLVKDADVGGIYDLKLLNEVLQAHGQPPVSAS